MSETNNNNKPKINMPRFNLSWLYVIIAMSFGILYFSNQEGGIDKQITYTEFKDMVNAESGIYNSIFSRIGFPITFSLQIHRYAIYVHSHKRPLKDGIDFGYVGDVERANGKMLQTLINEGITPVMAPLTHDAVCKTPCY